MSVGIALQLFILAVPIIWFARYSALFYFVYVTIATIAVLKIISGGYEAAYKIAWVVLVLSVPMFGAVMYLLYGGNKIDIRSRQKMHQQEACMRTSMGSVTPETKAALEEQGMAALNQGALSGRSQLLPAPYPHGDNIFSSGR